MRAAPLAASLALLAAPVAARADATVTALPRDRFDPAELTIDPGERVTFANRDIAVHDVVGQGFRSARTDPGRDAPVEGAERLAPGRYAFACSLHSHMTGTLVVRGQATEPPPPPPPGADTAPPPDTTAPRLAVRVRGRVVRVTVDEAARIVVRAAGRTLRRRTGGPATVRLRLRARPRRVTVTATDAAGNRRTVVRRTPARRY
ncbi:MAG TPA: cupredoxin domain-containing protein [Solirubrobacteraceae bacterium]|nr:cupredoxin domain-containing protein [Solirubrobacteraceae bacterium]